MLTKSDTAGKILPGLRTTWATETENGSANALLRRILLRRIDDRFLMRYSKFKIHEFTQQATSIKTQFAYLDFRIS
jgi:hypothetical protein